MYLCAVLQKAVCRLIVHWLAQAEKGDCSQRKRAQIITAVDFLKKLL